jgi:hypothetical protein
MIEGKVCGEFCQVQVERERGYRILILAGCEPTQAYAAAPGSSTTAINAPFGRTGGRD